MRVALDLALAPGIVEQVAGSDAAELTSLCDEMTAAAHRDESFAAADRAFHLALAARLGNELYAQLVAAFWDVHTIVAPSLGVPSTRDAEETASAHRAMLDAAMSGNLDAYRETVAEHYAPLMRSLGSAREHGEATLALQSGHSY